MEDLVYVLLDSTTCKFLRKYDRNNVTVTDTLCRAAMMDKECAVDLCLALGRKWEAHAVELQCDIRPSAALKAHGPALNAMKLEES